MVENIPLFTGFYTCQVVSISFVACRCSAEIHRMQLQRNAVLRDQWQQSLCSLTNAAINRREIDIIAYNSSINICTLIKT